MGEASTANVDAITYSATSRILERNYQSTIEENLKAKKLFKISVVGLLF